MSSVKLPLGENAVRVSVIDNGARITGPMSFFMDPALLEEYQNKNEAWAPAYAFLVENPKLQRKIVFDLGIRAKAEDYPPYVLKYHQAFSLKPGLEISDLLQSEGFALDSVEAAVWRLVIFDYFRSFGISN